VDAILNNRNHNRDQSFTYDELNRVQTAQSAATAGGDCWGLQFGFDIYANLLSASVTKCAAPILGLTINASNRISNSGFAYDAAGNLTADGSYSYQWDAESRIKAGAGVNYTYDGDGKRVQKSSGKLYWYGLSSDPLAESDAAGSMTDEYVFLNGKRIARQDSGGILFYYLADHLGTSRVVVQAGQAAACQEADYYPYGGERVITSNCAQPYKFTGKERDTESGLDYLMARYYSSGLGRFASPDEFIGGPVEAWSANDPLPPGPLPYANITDPQSLNKYAYVMNNPLRYIDPTGHALMTPWGGRGDMPAIGREGGGGPILLSEASYPGEDEKDTQAQPVPPPTGPNGQPLPPPVPLPPGKGGKPNEWVPGKGTNDRPTRWEPKLPIPGQSQPNASWDPQKGHWDYNDGKGNRTRYLPDGTKVDHNNYPIPRGHRIDLPNASPTPTTTVVVTTVVVIYLIVRTVSRIVFPWSNLVPI
jgi:RHS repeat-associated protein